MTCLMKSVVVENCCGDYSCPYYGACATFVEEVPDESLDSQQSSEFNSEGFQTVMEEDDIVDAMTITEDDDFQAPGDTSKVLEKLSDNYRNNKELKKEASKLKKSTKKGFDDIEL